MSKRILITLLTVVGLAALVWVYAESIADGLQSLWNLNDATRGKIKDWSSIVSGGIGATMWGFEWCVVREFSLAFLSSEC